MLKYLLRVVNLRQLFEVLLGREKAKRIGFDGAVVPRATEGLGDGVFEVVYILWGEYYSRLLVDKFGNSAVAGAHHWGAGAKRFDYAERIVLITLRWDDRESCLAEQTADFGGIQSA